MPLTKEEFTKRVYNAARANYKWHQRICSDGHTNNGWPSFDSIGECQDNWLSEAEATLRAGFPEMCPK